MHVNRSSLSRVVFLITLLIMLFPGIYGCGQGTGVAAGSIPLTVLSTTGGSVQILKADEQQWTDGEAGMTLKAGYKVKTNTGSKATLTFFDGSTIDLKENTEISLDDLVASSSSSPRTIKLGQVIGETTSRVVKLVDPASRYDIETQAGVAAVRGTTMVVQVDLEGRTNVYNVEGSVTFTAQGQEIIIPGGYGSTIIPGEAPRPPEEGLPDDIGTSGATSISSKIGWQQTELLLKSGDKFFVEYRGGGWSVDYRNFPYAGPAGYTAEVDKTVATGYKVDASVPYGFLLGKVGESNIIHIGNNREEFTAPGDGYLFLRVNDLDMSLGDNDGAISVEMSKTPASSQSLSSGNNDSTDDLFNSKGEYVAGEKYQDILSATLTNNGDLWNLIVNLNGAIPSSTESNVFMEWDLMIDSDNDNSTGWHDANLFNDIGVDYYINFYVNGDRTSAGFFLTADTAGSYTDVEYTVSDQSFVLKIPSNNIGYSTNFHYLVLSRKYDNSSGKSILLGADKYPDLGHITTGS